MDGGLCRLRQRTDLSEYVGNLGRDQSGWLPQGRTESPPGGGPAEMDPLAAGKDRPYFQADPQPKKALLESARKYQGRLDDWMNEQRCKQERFYNGEDLQ